jgi:hypothetical protein
VTNRKLLGAGALSVALALGAAGCGSSSPSGVARVGHLPVATDAQMANQVAQSAIDAHVGPTTVFTSTGSHAYPATYIPGGNLRLTAACLRGTTVKVTVGNGKLATLDVYCPVPGGIQAGQDTWHSFPAGTYTVTVKAAPGERWWVSGFAKL